MPALEITAVSKTVVTVMATTRIKSLPFYLFIITSSLSYVYFLEP